MLTVAVLGPVEVRRDGVPLAVPSGKTTELLIRLAVDAGTPVRAERLIDDLWADQPAGVARNTLQVKVSKLRRALGDPALITGGVAGYTLHLDPQCVDALRPEAVAGAHGEILPDAGAWAAPHRARISEARLRFAEQAGLPVADLEELVGDHPLREGLWHALISELYRTGRQADALAAYQRARRMLADELGLDPGPDLQDLHRRILRPPQAGNLPALIAPLIGRDADLAALAGDTERLVTVAGPAGVGKTRLAIEVARREPAAWLVRLDDTPAVWPAVGAALGLGEATPAMVLDRLAGLDALLLLLDNCEHLVAEVSAAALRILDAAPGLRILATSQVPLGLDGEIVYDLEPLTPADSVTLFRRQAARRRRSFDADRQAIEEVCRALDGLPLAIELAAARTRSLSVQEIGRRLDDRFTLLGDPAGPRPARQRTLRAALGWSYDLLFPDDQRGLWALATFTGGAPLAAAEQVLDALGVPAVDVLDRLVDRSLAIADIAPDGPVRYRLLDSVRAYGRERLHESGAEEVAAGAHAAWFAAAAGRAADGLRGPAQAKHLAEVRAERANIDAALTWLAAHDPALALRTAIGFGWAWVFLGAGREAADRMRSLLTPAAPVADQVAALLFAGWFEASGGNVERALADIDAAGRLAHEPSAGDADLSVRVRLFRAFVRSQQGRPRDALRELADLGATGWEEGAAWLLRAWAEIALGEIGRGREACDEALRLLDDDWALGHAEALLGALAQAEHRYADAVAHLSRATAAAERLGFLGTGSLHRANLGRALQQHGDPDAAVIAFERAIATAHAAGDLRIVALSHTRLARVLRALGRNGEARDHVATARRWYATAGGGDGALLAEHLAAALDDDAEALRRVAERHDPETEALSLDALARIAAAQGRTDEAAALFAEADRLAPPHLVTDDDRIDKRRAQGLPKTEK